MGPHWSLTGVRGVAAAALVVPQREPVDRVAGDGGDAAEDLRARDALGLGVGVDPLGEVARPEAPHVGEGQLGGRRAPAACDRPGDSPWSTKTAGLCHAGPTSKSPPTGDDSGRPVRNRLQVARPDRSLHGFQRIDLEAGAPVKLIRNTVVALAVVLALPAAAEAHTVTPSIDCSAAMLVYDSTPGTTLSYEILINGVSTVKSSFAVPSSPVSGTLTVPYTAPAGLFTASVVATFSTGESGSATQSMTCIAPPQPTPPPPPHIARQPA